MSGYRRFIGRDTESAVLGDCLARAQRGMGSVLLLSGEAGAGKTRMHHEALVSARAADVVALTGHADHDAQDVPLAALVASLRAARQGSGDRVWPYLVVRGRWLSAILPELSTSQTPPDPLAGDRHVLFECLLYAVSEAAGRSAAMWILDDMQWADPWSWSFVRHASRGIGRLPIVLVVSYRPDQVASDAGVATLAELAQGPNVIELRLGRLLPRQTEELVRSVAPIELDADTMASIVRRSGGNPAIATDLAGAGVADATIIPPSVRAFARARLSMLSPAARDLLELVATVGGRAHLELLSDVGSGADDQALTELLHAGLARLEGGGWLRCDYPLLAEAVYEQIPWSRRRAIQLKIADAAGGGSPPAWTDTLELTSSNGHAPERGSEAVRTNGAHSAAEAPERVSSRELQIAELIAQGLTNRAIAHRLYLSPHTVGTHVKNLLAKLQFSSRSQIAAWLADHVRRVEGAREANL